MRDQQFNNLAIRYAEKYGIIEYTRHYDQMFYEEVVPQENTRYVVQVHLGIFKEVKRTAIPL